MDRKINITQKLLKIVKNRKTLLVVNKQESGYNRNRKVKGVYHMKVIQMILMIRIFYFICSLKPLQLLKCFQVAF